MAGIEKARFFSSGRNSTDFAVSMLPSDYPFYVKPKSYPVHPGSYRSSYPIPYYESRLVLTILRPCAVLPAHIKYGENSSRNQES